MAVSAYGAGASDKPLEPLTIVRRWHGPHDVAINIACCSVCHSDLHQVSNDWDKIAF